MDMKNKKSNKEIVLDPESNQLNIQQNSGKAKLHGLNDKFPVENFIKLVSTQKGKTIHLQTYKYPSQKDNIKGVVYLIHGLYEYSNSNANIAKFLAENGYEVLSFDLRGHGKSEGIRGYFEGREYLTDDINKFISLTENEYSNKTKNKYIFGYSLGGLLSNLVCYSRPDYFNGMILLAPAFYDDTTKHSNFLKIARILNYIFPTLPLIEIEGKPEDKSIQEYIANEPLFYKGKLRVGTGLTIIDSIQYSNENIPKINTPCYLLQGQKDAICKPQGATNFFNRLTINDKTLIMLDDLDHFIVRNQRITFFLNDIVFWMAEHNK